MIYLLDKLDLELLEIKKDGEYLTFDLWETTETRVKKWMENERCRSIFSRKEIINLFKTGKIQMIKIDKIKMKYFDKIIVWTKSGRYFVLENFKEKK